MYQHENIFEADAEADVFEMDEYEGEEEWDNGEIFNEADLMELSAQLLEVNTEEELNYFLGNLVKKAARAAGKIIRSPIGKALGGVLKTVAKKALPIAGGALGGIVGGPLGAKIGSGLAGYAGKALGLEAELVSQEENEFQGAQQFVRIAGDTVKRALNAPPGVAPQVAAQNAAVQATRIHAPGLLNNKPVTSNQRRPSTGGNAGRWVRRGRHIVIYNV